MGLFGNTRKPRRFHHPYIYVDQRKEEIDKRVEQVKRDLELSSQRMPLPEDIREVFAGRTAHLKRRKQRAARPLAFGILLILIGLLLALWHYLQSGNEPFPIV